MIGSCKKEGITLSKDQALAKSQSQANASSSGGAFEFHDVFRQNLDGEQFYNPCTNEQMTATTWDRLINFHGIYNGTKSTIIFHINVQGFKTVGESGTEYVLSATYNSQESYFSNGVFTTKLVHHVRATTPGGGNSFILTDTYYIKVDADGNITILRDPVYEISCP